MPKRHVMEPLLILLLLPVVVSAILLLIPSERMQYVLSAGLLAVLSATALSLYMTPGILSFGLGHTFEWMIVVADVALLLYFVYQGLKFDARRVTLLAVVQLLLYGWAESVVPEASAAAVIVDDLSKFMFLIMKRPGRSRSGSSSPISCFFSP